MIQGNALLAYKQNTLATLDNYKGMEQSEQQVIQDFQISYSFSARPDDVRQALAALYADGLVERRRDPMRGWVWRINKAGRLVAAELDLEQ